MWIFKNDRRMREPGQAPALLNTLQAVEIALQPVSAEVTASPSIGAKVEKHERFLAELTAILHERGALKDEDVLRLIGRFAFEKA